MDAKKIALGLHALERKVLPLLKKYSSVPDLMRESKLKDVEVVRALQWLENKELITLTISKKDEVRLSQNGQEYLDKGLPEKRFLSVLEKGGKGLSSIQGGAALSKEEVNICLGMLRRKNLISMEKHDGQLLLSITDSGKDALKKESQEEQFLKKEFPLLPSSLQPEENHALEELRKRGIVLVKEAKEKSAKLTALGKEVASQKMDNDAADRLTSAMLKTGSWKKQHFRPYDISINVPAKHFGRRHFVREATHYARQIWLELGFEEMNGSLVQTGFWNFDALFTPQDHPVRDMQDTFYLKDAHVPLKESPVIKRVKETHENGWTTGSTGWGGKWSVEEAKRNVLRTHTTVLSAQTIAQLKESELPKRYFSVGSCFRNETLDWSHLFEFHQSEGIVVDPDGNLKQLIGYLRTFFAKMGFPKVRARPAYFPYTEPSVEVDVFDPLHKEWLELGGAGIFRPEVVKPLLGKEIPVLAWGLGLARLIPRYYGIKDIRELHTNDLRQLREIKAWMM
ncbi:MAG: phenylalanine--tRNA ligase subunit alpha [Nanoarchaeota archaeon]